MFSKSRFGTFLGGLTLFGLLANGIAFGAEWKILPGHVPPAVAHIASAGVVPATNQMRLAIGVPLRDPAGMDRFLAQLYAPASPNYRQYLTPEQFTERFGPTEEQYQAVIQFARANGLTIVQTHSNRLVLDVAGPAAAVENALHIRLHTYQHPTEPRHFFAPDAEPTVSVDLPVADIQGLSDFARPHPRLKKSNAVRPNVVSKDGSAPDGSGSLFGNDFRNAYAPGTALTGAGQQVGLLEFDGYYASDIAAYASAAGAGRASIPIQAVLLDGYDGTPTDNGNGEVSLDIEMAMAMAPGLAKIVVFEAGPSGFQNDILNSMVAHSTVKTLACCWGWGGGPSTTTDNIFKAMAAQGQSFFNASGDSDAFTVGVGSANSVDDPNGANAPSSSPYITQVGGTTLNMNGSGSSYGSETVWNWGGGTGSSGGVSSYYAIPSWQSGISMTANRGSTTQRNIPDVALNADNAYVTYGRGQISVFGGTSCAAPLWAGFVALVNQQAASLGNGPAGLINPAVYAIGKGQNAAYSYAACFHDTTSGNNFWSLSPNNYPAVSGYDLCTGWGTPNGAGLIAALAGGSGGSGGGSGGGNGQTNTITATNGVSISPLTGFAFSGAMGGPFVPASGTFQLSNASATSVKWSLICTSSWLKVGTTNGTLTSNSAASVVLNPALAANTLKVGSYSTSLAFSNWISHVAQRIPVTLQVTQPMTVSPVQGFTALGPVSGPFAPNSQIYVLSNASGSPLKWSLANSVSWLTVSASSGTIPAGGQVSVTVSISTSARMLRASVYNTSISFSDAAGVVATVPFTLSIGQPLVRNGGFESGSFAGWTQSGNTAFTAVMRGLSAYLHSGAYGAELGPSITPGYLSQTIPTVAGQTYKLSLWLRNASGTTPNWFEVDWNGSPVFELANRTTTTWTNVQLLVTATGSSSVLQLGFQDDPDYLGLDDVSLIPTSSSSIKSTASRAGDFQMAWNTTFGVMYQPQYKTNLSQPDWINLGGAITANADTLTLTDTNALRSSPQRFYRLLALPPQ